MKRLNKQRCYLAGAIDRVPDRGNGWRDFITPFLESLGVEVFNPLKKPTNLAIEDQSVAKHKKQLNNNHNTKKINKSKWKRRRGNGSNRTTRRKRSFITSTRKRERRGGKSRRKRRLRLSETKARWRNTRNERCSRA